MKKNSFSIGSLLALLFLYSCQDSPSSLPDLEIKSFDSPGEEEDGNDWVLVLESL